MTTHQLARRTVSDAGFQERKETAVFLKATNSRLVHLCKVHTPVESLTASKTDLGSLTLSFDGNNLNGHELLSSQTYF